MRKKVFTGGLGNALCAVGFAACGEKEVPDEEVACSVGSEHK